VDKKHKRAKTPKQPFKRVQLDYGTVKQICRAVLKYAKASQADFDDLVQDTALTVLEKGRAFKGQAEWKTWVYAIARNLWISKKRHADVEARYVERKLQECLEETD